MHRGHVVMHQGKEDKFIRSAVEKVRRNGYQFMEENEIQK